MKTFLQFNARRLILLTLLLTTLNEFAQNGLSNLSFENWSTTSGTSTPTGWFGFSISQQNTGAQQGNKYVRITNTSVVTGTSTSNPNGLMYLTSNITGPSGAPYTQKPTSLNGFYKTSGLGTGDSVGIMCFFTDNGNVLNYDYFYSTTNVANWTSFSIPFIFFSAGMPDTVMIYAFANPWIMGAGPNAIGAKLDLDNLSFALATGIDQESIGTSFLVFPNPASNELNIISKDPEASMIRMIDVQGQIVEEINILDEKTTIDLDKYSAGIYSYSILNKSGGKLLTNKLVITK